MCREGLILHRLWTLAMAAAVILGGGAMGSLWAAVLARAGYRTCVVTRWAAHIRAIRKQQGLRYTGLERDKQVLIGGIVACETPVEAQQMLQGRATIGILSVKGPEATAAAAEAAGQLLDSDGLLLTLQNGMGNEEAARAAIGRSDVGIAVGTTTHGAIAAAGCVEHTGWGETVVARPPEAASASHLEELARSLQSGVGAGWSMALVPWSEKDTILWKKLVINAGINPITAILGIQNGEIAAGRPHGVQAVSGAAVAEAVRVAQCVGIRVEGGEAGMAAVTLRVCEETAMNTSSMLSDVRRMRPTEVESITGWVCAEGRRVGVATPTNDILLALVRQIEAGEIRPCTDHFRKMAANILI